MRRKLLISMTITVLLLISLLTGCQPTTVDYTINDSEGTQSLEASGVSFLEQFSGASQWTETFSVAKTNGEVLQIQIDASITVPDIENMGVVEVKWMRLDAGYKEQMLQKLCPDSELYTCRDINGEADLENYDIPVTDYEVNNYRGERDGFTYYISFSDNIRNEFVEEEHKSTGISFHSEYKELLPNLEGDFFYLPQGAIYDPKGPVEVESMENKCELSREEAKERAEAFLDEIGITDYVYNASTPAVWTVYEIDAADPEQLKPLPDVEAGYTFYYGQEWQNIVEDHSLFYANINITVTDAGVAQMQTKSLFEMVSLTENVELLPLETIQRIMRNEMIENPDIYFKYVDNNVGCVHMELQYYRLKDEKREDYYSYIPVWELSGNGSRWSGCVRVNAIDGSIIYD